MEKAATVVAQRYRRDGARPERRPVSRKRLSCGHQRRAKAPAKMRRTRQTKQTMSLSPVRLASRCTIGCAGAHQPPDGFSWRAFSRLLIRRRLGEMKISRGLLQEESIRQSDTQVRGVSWRHIDCTHTTTSPHPRTYHNTHARARLSIFATLRSIARLGIVRRNKGKGKKQHSP